MKMKLNKPMNKIILLLQKQQQTIKVMPLKEKRNSWIQKNIKEFKKNKEKNKKRKKN
jgi:hypothetical protein